MFTQQDYIYPVYVYSGFIKAQNETVPMNLVTLPATDFSPPTEDVEVPTPTTSRNRDSETSTAVPQ